MASLQSMLGRSVQQNLGISDFLEKSSNRAMQTGKAVLQAGTIKAGGEVKQRMEKEASKKGLFETLGTIMGAVGGFALGGPGGALAGLGALGGASLGSKVGGGLGGLASGTPAGTVGSGPSSLIQGGLDLATTVDSANKTLLKKQAVKKDKLDKELLKRKGTEAEVKVAQFINQNDIQTNLNRIESETKGFKPGQVTPSQNAWLEDKRKEIDVLIGNVPQLEVDKASKSKVLSSLQSYRKLLNKALEGKLEF